MYYLNKGTDEGQQQIIAETVADIAKVPTATTSGDTTAAVGPAHRKVAFGSVAWCIPTGDVYILTSNNQWTKVSG
jgi:hypothetical protein